MIILILFFSTIMQTCEHLLQDAFTLEAIAIQNVGVSFQPW